MLRVAIACEKIETFFLFKKMDSKIDNLVYDFFSPFY